MITQRARCFLAWAALAACGSGGGGGGGKGAAGPTDTGGAAAGGQPGDASCQQAVDHLFSVTSTDEDPAIRARAVKVFRTRCDTDRWSVEIRRCLAEVKQPADSDVCEQMLSPEQSLELRHELAKELDAAGVKPEMQGGGPKPQAPAK